MNKLSYKILNKLTIKGRLLRFRVFVLEQGISLKDEYDSKEKDYSHLYYYLNTRLIGYLRFQINDKDMHIGRVIVNKKYRNNGFGKELFNILEDLYKDQIDMFILNSQESAIMFYSKLGFIIDSERFKEANINHYKMIKYINK